ncbi:MAG TPA: NADH:ubiquinone reductase (Na(+)-transporting) subunit A, partial [Candidatus Hydrogenedentes bacterium]|nr:NADH:ubiquinone reductase (Na(+)-transporting) subunit A [Candidatus Hydrogenedentota bacterium]
MGTHVIKKGLDIPLAGVPDQSVLEEKRVHTAGVAAADYPGLRTTFFVQAGDAVKRGQPLFEDKRNPGVLHTAPG